MKPKKKAVRSTRTPHWLLNEKTAPPIVALGVMVGVILLTLLFHSVVKPKDSTEPKTTTTSSAITLNTTDGLTIAGDLSYPSGAGPFPIVILLHEFGQDRSQWSPYREFFIGEGFAVMRYDIRGFGESALASIPTAQSTWFSTMPQDLTAAVQYAAAQSKVDHQKIYVIGVGLGANVAYVGSGTNAMITKTVMLTPTVNPQLDGSTVDDFFPKRLMGIANTTDQAALNALMARATDIESQSIVLDDASARGLGILDDETARERIVNWLEL